MKKLVFSSVGIVLLAVIALFGYRAYLISELRKPVLAELSDPDSAQFRNERYQGPWSVESGTLCGEINAKNKMGGYVGYKPFYVAYGEMVQVDGDAKMHSIMCEDFKDEAPWWWLRW